MAPPADPYRTLGLGRDATLDEVKRAYRRLAKVHHPDAAGEAAVPRFLAIKAAYEAILGPEAGAPGRAARRPPTPGAPWAADPDRTDATRRAYGSRSRRARSKPRPEPGPRPGSGPAGGVGADRASERPPGSVPPDGDPTERPPNLATLGSTTYDAAAGQPFEPDWAGAAWYGPTSGTYWTLNPKEYADPRKHGPEYQARARRGRRGDAGAPPTEGVPPESPEPQEPPVPPVEPTEAGHTAPATAAGPAEDVAPGAPGSAGPPDPAAPAPPPQDHADPAPTSDVRARWLDDGPFGLPGRIGTAVVGWAPIAAAIGLLAGEITGCARAATTCGAGEAPIAWFAQVAVLAVLLLVPLLGRLTATAGIAVLAVAVPVALLLGGLPGSTERSAAQPLAVVVLVIAWLVGLGLATRRESQRFVRPVS